MKKIYKYPLEIDSIQKLLLPIDAEILTVQDGRDGPCIWAMVDPEEKKEEVIIRIYSTGEEMSGEEDTINSQRVYIGTFQQAYGELVWHVFQLIEDTNI